MSFSAMYPRALGLLTFGYGAYTAIRPQALAYALCLESPDRPLPRSTRVLSTLIGSREMVTGASMLLAPTGIPLRVAVTARVACDVGDVIVFGLTVPRSTRARAVAVAAGWGALCATSLLAIEDCRGRP